MSTAVQISQQTHLILTQSASSLLSTAPQSIPFLITKPTSSNPNSSLMMFYLLLIQC